MYATLLLNATYEPLKVISWKKAMTLLCLDKAEVLACYQKHVRSTRLLFELPAVMRLRSRVPWRRLGVRFSRRHVFVRDRFSCQYCGQRFPTRDLTFDHVMPKSRGGRTCWNNIVTSCRECNQEKAGRTPDEAGMPLLNQPHAPSWLPPQVRDENQSTPHPLWEPYLW